MAEGGAIITKYLLFIFNLLFWISGLALIIAGAVIQVKYTTYINFLGNSFLSAPTLLIVVGVFVTIFGFLGCCGAIRESHCMIMTFGVLLGLILILEFAAGIASYVKKNDVQNFLKDKMLEGMGNYVYNSTEGVTFAWDDIQTKFACCGINESYGYLDWDNNPYSKTNGRVPDSCCKVVTPGCGQDALKPPQPPLQINSKGCESSLKDWVKHNAGVIGGIGVAFAFVQIIGIALSCCLGRSIRQLEAYRTV